MTLRRKLSTEEREQIEAYQQQEETARQLRERVERFKTTFSLDELRVKLPLRFLSELSGAEALRFRALSWYTYPGWAALTDPGQLAVMSAFYIALHLIDFSALRTELVALIGIALDGRGQTPFDPVSLFLCCLLRLEKGLGWKSLADFLAGPEAECWRRLLGFHSRTPGASTMRAFFKALGSAFDTDLCPRFIELLDSAGLLPHHAGTSSPSGLPLAADGMLHQAHASMRCGKVTATCYWQTSPDSPRPCPAREAGQEGCTCTDDACAQVCRLATPRDPEARLIHYTGSNHEGEQDSSRAHDVYGYRSYAQLLCDDQFHVSWIAHTSVHPANADERTIFPIDFTDLVQRLPDIPIVEAVADAAIGYKNCLLTAYDAGVIPLFTIRRDPSDKDEAACRWRGYDGNGHPLCAHGYPMAFNGVDYQRLRACWVCRQVCTRLPESRPEDVDCPFRDPDRSLGQVRHVGRVFVHPDGSRHERLARLYPYGSDLWKAHYARRKNAVEGRNSQLTRLGLKRMWSYGLAGATADIAFADLLLNLRTLGRLVQQATALVTHHQAAAT
jgi:hypothetical protein